MPLSVLVRPPDPESAGEGDGISGGIDRGVAAAAGECHGQGSREWAAGLERSAAEVEGRGPGPFAQGREEECSAVEVVGPFAAGGVSEGEAAGGIGAAGLREGARAGVADVLKGADNCPVLLRV